MTDSFCVLASGSSGNSSLVRTDSFALLIDSGIGPRTLSARLGAVECDWTRIGAMVLTHTHSDHWNERTLAQLRSQNVPVWMHPDHGAILRQWSPSYEPLRKAGLIRYFANGEIFSPGGSLQVLPIEIPHDSKPTFAFRIEGGRPGQPHFSLGYASDLGCVTDRLRDGLRGIDLLAIEFNHDVGLQMRSGRPAQLINRVLGDEGHLSNRQAAAALGTWLELDPHCLNRVFQLHLSRQCNRPDLARVAALEAIRDSGSEVEVFTASQELPTKMVPISTGSGRTSLFL